ncbi:hypothetical protein M422DRAFT_243987 [Sphaerobolus stellatus SS14]|nr:hypothetical protein M422DRAFT_243987 [Sphaerobolus stellatus SS14]
MASPAVSGLFLVLYGAAHLRIEKISFLNVNQGGQIIHFGVFGYTGTAKHVGYFFDSIRLGLPGKTKLNNDVSTTSHSSSSFTQLVPAGLSVLAVLFGLCGAAYCRIGTIFMTVTVTLALLVTLVV